MHPASHIAPQKHAIHIPSLQSRLTRINIDGPTDHGMPTSHRGCEGGAGSAVSTKGAQQRLRAVTGDGKLSSADPVLIWRSPAAGRAVHLGFISRLCGLAPDD